MANTSSAKKMIRKINRRTEINQRRRSRIRSFIRKVEEAIAEDQHENAALAMKNAQPEIMRGAHKGIFHKNTAARKISRLTQRVAQLAKPAAKS